MTHFPLSDSEAEQELNAGAPLSIIQTDICGRWVRVLYKRSYGYMFCHVYLLAQEQRADWYYKNPGKGPADSRDYKFDNLGTFDSVMQAEDFCINNKIDARKYELRTSKQVTQYLQALAVEITDQPLVEPE